MRSRSFDEDLVSGLSMLAVVGLGIAGLHWLGVDTGITRWLVCKAGVPIVVSAGPLLVQLAGIFGFLLVLVPYTRPAGISLLVFAGLGLVGIEFAAGQAGTYCGFTGGDGFTP